MLADALRGYENNTCSAAVWPVIATLIFNLFRKERDRYSHNAADITLFVWSLTVFVLRLRLMACACSPTNFIFKQILNLIAICFCKSYASVVLRFNIAELLSINRRRFFHSILSEFNSLIWNNLNWNNLNWNTLN